MIMENYPFDNPANKPLSQSGMPPIRFGVDQACLEPQLLPGKIALVTNHSARTARDPNLSSRAALLRAGVTIVRLFAPEHGLQVTAPDGARVSDTIDTLTGLPVASLYGDRMRPSQEDLADLDTVVFDLPDIGSRFYTYIWTLYETFQACTLANKKLVVLDRPNPLGGAMEAVEGPLLDVENCGSFLGRHCIPIRHSLTAGELLRLWASETRADSNIDVIPCTGWKRHQHWPELGLEFVPTSPAMPSYFSALTYPGICLFEGTNLSVGRGSATPFQVVGAPWLNSAELSSQLNRLKLPGIVAEAIVFNPTQNPWSGCECQGVRLRITDPARFRPVHTGLALLCLIAQEHPDAFGWAAYPTAANPSGAYHFDRLIGRPGLRELIGKAVIDTEPRLWTQAPGWVERVKASLLYS